MKINGSRINMSHIHRLKIGGILAGIVIFFIINRIFPGPIQPDDITDTHTLEFNQAFNKQVNREFDQTFIKPMSKGLDQSFNRPVHREFDQTLGEQENGPVDNAEQTVVVKPPDLTEHTSDRNDRYISDTLLSEDDYTNYLFKATDADLQDQFVNKHKYEFILNNKYACDGNVFVVALIHSAPQKVAERRDIRSTWGSVKFFSGAVIIPLFLLAQTQNSTLQQEVIRESQTYRDIIQGNFIDSYRNLTYKNVMGLHWVRTHCKHAMFFLKTDDDTMVDVYHLIHFLFQKSPDGNLQDFLYCSTFKNQGPRRIKDDKWFVPVEEYPYRKYPPYCEGFAYVMSADVIEKLYDVSKSVKVYWIDDVYTTGFLALKGGIYHRDMENGHAYNLMTSQHLSKHAQSSIFLLAKYEQHRKSWHKAWSDIQTIHKIGD